MSAAPLRRVTKAPARLPAEPRGLVVGVRLDGASALALKRGFELARVTMSGLTVAYVLPLTPRGSKPSEGWVRDVMSRRAREGVARAAVQRWALKELGVAIPEDSLLIRFGEPAEELARAATALDAWVVIIGGRPYATSAGPGQTTRGIVARTACAVFVSGMARAGAGMVAATDMGTHSLPVLAVASALAEQLGRRVSVVHNVDGVVMHGARYPLPAGIREQVLGARLDRLSDVVRRDARVDDARVMHERDAATAILRAARTDDADLIVLGRRSAPGRTIRRVLADARRSVLVVPVSQRDLQQ
ncbi:MAG: universal stress protein [Polyangiaceae bacterium]|nr:universal stress protein [Polyangiaceae bacterium]